MGSASASDLFEARTGTGCGEDLFVAAVDVAGLGDEGLSSRLGVIGRAESRLAAMKSQVLAEVERRHDATAAQRIAREELQSSAREAKRDVESATRLSGLSATSAALESGEIPQGHARLIARASGESDIDETILLDSAKRQDFDAFAKTVRRHQQDQSKDDGEALLDRQRKSRKARIFESAETGMFVLSAEFDQITGARIATALTAKERQLWHNEDPKKRRTPQQRMADALAELICEPGTGKGQGTDLLVIADYDVLQQQLVNARLADGSPIPIAELHRMVLEADILPSIFDAKSQNMWLGRARRTASEAQRVALMARDQHCVGCGANPLWCRAHHIIWWRDGGPTDLDNLLLVCDSCHHKIHEQGWTVYQHPKTGKYELKPPASGPVSAQSPADRPNLDRKRVTTTAFNEHRSVTITCRPPPAAVARETAEEPQQPTHTSDRPKHHPSPSTDTFTVAWRLPPPPATGNEQRAADNGLQATRNKQRATGAIRRTAIQPHSKQTTSDRATGNERPARFGAQRYSRTANRQRATGTTRAQRYSRTANRQPATSNPRPFERRRVPRRGATSDRQQTAGNGNKRRATARQTGGSG